MLSVHMTMHRQAYSARSQKAPERREGAMACSAAVPDRDGMVRNSAASPSLLTATVQGRSISMCKVEHPHRKALAL